MCIRDRIAAYLREHGSVVIGVGLADAWELVVLRPVEFTAVHNHAAHHRAVAADEFGSGMHHDVPVSYTHLDVYKRQSPGFPAQRAFFPEFRGGLIPAQMDDAGRENILEFLELSLIHI